jgi:hypothetical protein
MMKNLILLSILFLTISCSKNDNQDNTNIFPQTISPILISKGVVFYGNYNLTQHGEVISSQSDWNNFRNNYWIEGLSYPEANNVNFSTEMIILVFDTPRTTGGYDATINSIVENTSDIIVEVLYTGIGDVTGMPTRPYHFVKVPKSTKPVVFQ